MVVRCCAMPVKGLQQYCQERQLVATDKLQALQRTRLGVDGHYWLRKLYLQAGEPLQSATGGVPLRMNSVIKAELEQFKRAGITPVFIFPGLTALKKGTPYFGNQDRIAEKKTAAWEAYYKGDKAAAVSAFQANQGGFQYLEQIYSVLQLLRECNVEFLRAPYSSNAQLASFAIRNIFQAVYGSCDVLMYGAPRVITEIEFDKGTFDWVDLGNACRSMGLANHDQFIDACILSGCEALHQPFPNVRGFGDALNVVNSFQSGYYAIRHYQGPQPLPQDYLDNFLRARACIRHHLVLEKSQQGVAVEPLVKDMCPSDIHEVVGPRLPLEVILFIANGIVSPHAINNIISGVSLEHPPQVDAVQYRQVLDGLIPKKAVNLGVVTGALHPHFMKKSIVSIRWFDPSNELPIPHAEKAAMTLFNWQAKEADLQAELTRQKAAKVDIGFLLKWRQSGNQGGGGVRKQMEKLAVANSDNVVVQRPMETLSLVLMQALESRHYLALDHSLTQWGRAAAGVPSVLLEPMLLFLELLQDGLMGGDPFTPPPGSQALLFPLVKRTDKRSEILLVSRVACLMQLRLSDKAWDGPVDYDLLQFLCILRATHRCLRNLVEMLLLSLVLRGRVRLGPQEYAGVANMLPFGSEPAAHMGIVMKALLEGTDISQLKATFPTATNLEEDIDRTLQFWDQVMAVVSQLQVGPTAAVAPEVVDEFNAANAFLGERRQQLGK